MVKINTKTGKITYYTTGYIPSEYQVKRAIRYNEIIMISYIKDGE